MKNVDIKKIPERIDQIRLQKFSILNEEPSWVLRRLLNVLSDRVRIDDTVTAKIKTLAEQGPLVYALKYRSFFDLHFLRMRFEQLGLPAPSLAFGISPAQTGSISKFMQIWKSRAKLIYDEKMCADTNEAALKRVFDAKEAAAFFLVDEKTSRERYIHPEQDPLQLLIDFQSNYAGTIAVVPMLILYDRMQRPSIRPFWENFLGDPDRPGTLKRLLIAARKWAVPELLVGEPIHLMSQFEEFGSDQSWEEAPFDLRKRLVESINDRIRVNRGPEKLSRTEIKERVLQDPRVQRTVREMASKENAAEEKMREKAEAYVDEIAADQHFQVHHCLYYVLRYLFNKVFDGVDLQTAQFDRLKETNAAGSLVFVSAHKSHFDYLLVGYLCFINQMTIPLMAAGKNLAFWPVGPIIRTAGAFFIRRSFRGLGLYTYVFSAYLKVLVKEKININFYIEGGRSRTGKLLQPRLGMLGFLLQAIEEGAVEDINFVPSFIGYDQVPEEKSYLKELAGKEKKQESFWDFLDARKVLRKKYGKVYVRFYEAVSFRHFCEITGVDFTPGKFSLKDGRKVLADFAHYLMYGIVRAGIITPLELTAAAIMCKGKMSLSLDEIMAAAGCFAEILKERDFELSRELDDLEHGVMSALARFRRRGFIESNANGNGRLTYSISENRLPNLDFYRNGVINSIWERSLTAGLILTRPGATSEELTGDFELLTGVLSKELIINPLVANDVAASNAMESFRSKGWLSDRNEPTESGAPVLKYLGGVTKDLAKIYFLALTVTSQPEVNGFSLKDLIKRMSKLSREIWPDSDTAFPSLASVTVSNALTRFTEMGLIEYKPSRKYFVSVTDSKQSAELCGFLADILGI